MTYKQLHNCQYHLTNVLNEKFKEQILSISPNAWLCYFSHCQIFTVSLFELLDIPEPNLNPTVTESIETEHFCLISQYKISPEIEQLTKDLAEFIMNEGPQHDHPINPTT